MYSVPTEIIIDEQSFAIRDRGDYRVVLDCFSIFNDTEFVDDNERLFTAMLVFYENFETLEDLLELDKETLNRLNDELHLFINCGQASSPGNDMNYKTFDWECDSQMICAAINNVAHQEVRSAEYIHWWTFMGYFNSIGESTFSTVLNIRNKIVKGKKLEKHENEFKRNNPQYFNWNAKTTKQQEEDEWIKLMWNNDKVGE